MAAQSLSGDEDFFRPLHELVERQVLPMVDWYQRKKRWPRRLHKCTTAAVIVMGALIPIASAWSASTSARVFVGVVGVAITTVTSLAASYDWYRRWRIFTLAQSTLESELANWEFAIARARLVPPDDGRAEAIAATAKLLDAVNHARNEETEAFFESQGDRNALATSRFEE